MRKLSLLLAASVMAVGLAVSGGASAEDMPTNYEVLSKGEILMTSVITDKGRPYKVFTVDYGRAIYGCVINLERSELECFKISGSDKKAQAE